MFEEEAQVELAFPTDATIKRKEETDRPDTQESDEQKEYLNNLCGKEIIQLKSNAIPRGLVPLEKLFDQNDVVKEPKLIPDCDEVEEVNIETAT